MKELEKLELPKKTSHLFNINTEFKHYDATHQKTNNLQLLFDALLTMKPTSVESELLYLSYSSQRDQYLTMALKYGTTSLLK